MGAMIAMTEEEILARAAGITTGLKTHPKEVAEAIAASAAWLGLSRALPMKPPNPCQPMPRRFPPRGHAHEGLA